MMVSDCLYELALEYRKASLWKRMEEDQLFAVPLAGGRIGYASVMGAIGEHFALAVYPGEEGLRSYHILRSYGDFSEIEYSPALQNHVSIQVSFEAKSDLATEELAAAKDYAKRKGIRFAGKNAYPMFFKAEAGYTIWPDLTEQDQEDLAAGLRAAIEVARDKKLRYGEPGDFPGVDWKTTEIVLMKEEKGRFVRERIPMPQVEEYRPPEGTSWDELAAARIRRLPKRGVWQLGLVSVAVPISWEQSKKPILPTILAAIDMETDQLLHIRPVALYEERTHVMLNMFMQSVEEYGSRPVRIEIEDDFTEALLRSWCQSLQVKLVRKKTLAELRDAKRGLVMHLVGAGGPVSELEELSQMLDLMLELSEEELALVPPEIRQHLLEMEENMEIDLNTPEWLLEKLEDLNDAIEAADLNRMAADRSGKGSAGGRGVGSVYEREPGQMPDLCVISVSLGTGCYRHIRVPKDILLDDLADVILWAFDFVNDHAHAFFMDNHIWSEDDSYYCPEFSNPEFDLFYPMYERRSTDEYRLEDTGLKKDKKFKFVFDFGDQWTFQCRVLRVSEPMTDEHQLENAEIIRSKGEPPDQYGWDDWDDWDDDEDDDL